MSPSVPAALWDAGGIDRAVIHPVLRDPDSNESAGKAARPIRTASRSWAGSIWTSQNNVLAGNLKKLAWEEGTAILLSDPRSWPDDGTPDWLWPVAERLGIPVSLAAAAFLPKVGEKRHPGLRTSIDHMAVPPATEEAEVARRNLPRLLISMAARSTGGIARQLKR